MRSLALVSCALLIMTGGALAADVAPSAVPSLIEIAAGGIATAVVAAVAFVAQKLFGVTMDARHREALQSAVRTGAALALSIGADLVAQGHSPSVARADGESKGLDYIRQAVPDALRHFKQADNEAMLRAMLQAASVQLVPPAPPATAN